MYFFKVKHIYLNLKHFVSLSFHILISIALFKRLNKVQTHERGKGRERERDRIAKWKLNLALDHIVAVYYFWLRAKKSLYLPSTKT